MANHLAEGIFLLMLVIGTMVVINTKEQECEQQADILQLSSLSGVSMNDGPSVTADLVEPSFWSQVAASAKQTYSQLIPQTVVGFLNSSQERRDWLVSEEPGASSWTNGSLENNLDSQIFQLGSQLVGTNNSLRAAEEIQDYAQSASGFTLAVVDYLGFNALTSVKVLAETRSLQQALCVSYPGQIAQFYEDSVNPSLPETWRAQYLGIALAMTTLTVVLSGTDGLTSEFSDALSKVGLGDAWPATKPYLFDLANTVSEKASFLAFTVAEELAQRFPQNAAWAAGLTTYSIDSMADGLREEGYSDTAIEQKISGLVQAAGDASSPDEVALDADVIRYEAGAGLVVQVGSQNRIFLYTDSQTMEYIGAQLLEQVVPGFRVGEPTLLSVSYLEKDVMVYHQYTGGQNWIPTAPAEIAQPGDTFTMKIQVLSAADFVNDLPPVTLGNYLEADWMTDIAHVNSFSLTGDILTIGITQDPEVEGIQGYSIEGISSTSLGFNDGQVFLNFQITDIFGNTRAMRVYFDGYGSTSFGISAGRPYLQVLFMSYDGIRLKILYSMGDGPRVATIYLQDPSVLYTLGSVDHNVPIYVKGQSDAFEVESVTLNRQLEKSMMVSATTYDLGRLGSEIAYTVGKEDLGIDDLVIAEPSQGGPDLYSSDGQVVVQARLMTATEHYSPQNVQAAITSQLADMATQLKTSFRITPSAKIGYLVLSYLDPQDNIRTIVVVVPR